jgi:two-component sensor histidine kinase
MFANKLIVSTQVYLLAFSLALAVPIVAFGALSLAYYAAVERGRLERQSSQIARQTGAILDSEVGDLVAVLRALATSSSLLRGDLADFHAQARRLVEGHDEIVVLRTLGDKQLLNTLFPYGQDLPPAVAISQEDRQAFDKGHSRVSDVYPSPISSEPRVAVAMRPLPMEKPEYLLAITVPTSRFRDAITPTVPANWIIGVGDRRGVYVTHSSRHAEVSGRPGSPAYLANALADSGTFYAQSATGHPLLAGYYRSGLTGWITAANIPTEVLEGPMRRSLAALGIAAALVLAASALFAFLFSRRLAGSARALASRAQDLSSGIPSPPTLRLGVSEFSIIDKALDHAAVAIQERAALTQTLVEALQQKDTLLKEVNHRVKNSLQLVASLLSLQRGQIQEPEARRQFEEAARRINTIAHIHQRLYRDEHLDKVALDQVLTELCEDLNRAFSASRISIVCDAKSCFLPTERAIPLALIINELVTNALKYSFSEGNGGVIRIDCHQRPDAILLSVSDDGEALQADFDPSHSLGLGMKMITALTRQLRATIGVERRAVGKAFTLRVPIEGPEQDAV